MSWLIVAILSYFFLAIVALFDRYFLVGPIPSPKVYTFYVGILWLLLSLFFIPFGIIFPQRDILFLGLLTGLIRIFAILFLTKSIVESEISRVIPAIGGLLPVFTFLFFFLYLPRTEILNLSQIMAFILLLAGSVLITLKKFEKKFFTFSTLKYPIITAFLFALAFFLTKILYLKTNFLNGFFLVLIGGGLGAVSFLIFPKVRKDILSQKPTQKVSGIFILGQAFGGLGVFLQFYAIFLAKPGQVPLINALEGIRYIFLLFFVFLISFFNPSLLKEEMRGSILIQKIIAILLIGTGLAILALC
jgi:drug/metabolite transporter (DMT)-like permease